MSDNCYNCDRLQENLENAEYKIRRLEREISELNEKCNKYYDKADSAEFRIRNELEPRIEREKRSYDNWVTDPER